MIIMFLMMLLINLTKDLINKDIVIIVGIKIFSKQI